MSGKITQATALEDLRKTGKTNTAVDDLRNEIVMKYQLIIGGISWYLNHKVDQ